MTFSRCLFKHGNSIYFLAIIPASAAFPKQGKGDRTGFQNDAKHRFGFSNCGG